MNVLLLIALAQTSTAPGAQLDDQIEELQSRLDVIESRFEDTGMYDVAALIPDGGELADGYAAAEQLCVDAGFTACGYLIRPGVYETTRPIDVCETAHVAAHGATIRANDSHGVRLLRGGGCDASGSTWGGGTLVGVVTSTSVRPIPVGFDIQGSSVHVQNVSVQRFGRGVQAICGDANFPDQNDLGFETAPTAHCNHVQLTNVSATSNHLDGFYFRGADSNAGVIVGANAVHNCWHADDYLPPPNFNTPVEPVCANFHDASFLGNTWIAPHSSAAYDNTANPDGTKTRWFQYFSASANGRTTWIGPYAENGADDGQSGNGPSYMLGYGHLVFGGINNIRSPRGMTIGEWGAISRATFRSGGETAAGGYTTLCLGCDNSTSVFDLRVDHGTAGTSSDLRLQVWDSGWTELEASTATVDQMLQIWTADREQRPRGTIRMLKDTLLPACTSTTGVTWSSPSGLVVREDGDGMSLCDGSE